MGTKTTKKSTRGNTAAKQIIPAPEMTPLEALSSNPDNPRVIKNDQYKKLVKSLQNFPEMLTTRPLVADMNGTVLGGNMRLRALQEIGVAEIPVIFVDWDEEQQRQFIIKDNLGYGEWDWEALGNSWDLSQLEDWGMTVLYDEDDLTEMAHPDNADTEHPFATEIDRESNYVILKFDTDIDWLQAKTLFDLQTETGRRANGKPWSSGIGRVVNGAEAIKKLQS